MTNYETILKLIEAVKPDDTDKLDEINNSVLRKENKMDTEWYEYAEYTMGRKQDYGHHEYNSENGWICYDWDRGDYTETMQMKRPLNGKGWKPYRVFTGAGRFEDFNSMDEAILWANKNPYYSGITGPHTPTIREVNIYTGEVIHESTTQQSIKK